MRIGVFKRLLQGLAAVTAEAAAEKGEFSLFALIEKEEWYADGSTGSSWWLFFAGPWVWADRRAALEYLEERVRPYQKGANPFTDRISFRVVPPTDPYLEEVWEYCGTENGMVEIYDVEILGVTAKRGYIFASRRPAEIPQPQKPAAAV